jgi:hypothetical protein
MSAFGLYYEERHRLLGPGGSGFMLVNLFRAPLENRCRRRRSGNCWNGSAPGPA